MDHKTLIEIIRGKVEEIREVAGRFDAQGPLYQIDVDLALSKVRSLYNELLMLNKVSREPYQIPAVETISTPVSAEEPEKAIQPVAEKAAVVVPEVKKTAGRGRKKAEKKEEPQPEFELVTESVSAAPEIQKVPEPAIAEPVVIQEIPVAQPVKEPEPVREEPVKAEVPSNPEFLKTEVVPIAEKSFIPQDVLAELLSKFRGSDLATKLKAKPVTDIKTSVSLNDKIMFIRELFSNNTDAYSEAVVKLNGMAGLDEALAYINGNFNWDPKSNAFEKFFELIYRRFLKD